MYGYIYKTTNLENGKVYIGKKSNRKFSTKYLGSGILIKKAIDKYGIQSFKVEVLARCRSVKQVNKLEKDFIAFYRKEFGNSQVYNVTDGGDGGAMPPEIVKRSALKIKGRKMSETVMQKRRKQKRGSNCHKKGCSCGFCKTVRGEIRGKNHPNYGKPLSKKSRQAISKSKIGKQVGEKNPRWKGGDKRELKCLSCKKDFIGPSYRKYCSKECIPTPTGNKGTKHKQNCKCCFCKAQRGEYRGNKNPMWRVSNRGIPCPNGPKRYIRQEGPRIPWNKGLTKETDSRVAKYGRSGSETKRSKHVNKTKAC